MREALTAREVRALPLGSRVTAHVWMGCGNVQRIECEVVQFASKKALRYDDCGGFGLMAIKSGTMYTREAESWQKQSQSPSR